jgi:SAM-dependent methyltransferase
VSPETAQKLAAINEKFYRTRAAQFAAKRERPWPGMRLLLERLPSPPESVLDVGCAHGRFAALLRERFPRAGYVGIDASRELLALAEARSDCPARAEWLRVDIGREDAIPRGPFDLIGMFGVIHHIPGEERRARLLRALALRLAPRGTLAVAIWRAAAHDHRERAVPWEQAGIPPNELEPGDRLLPFDGEATGLRFAHFADEQELARVARAPGLRVERFDSDGPSGAGNAYLLWRGA